ncbi:hypothetical protein CS063_14510 [Sporanaerobium hydrogeniformans]|uniref:Uncharacterized protein n=1 Tax=Sporanaerobium hydrogeniformans TaxID=3072179 RepID=A0AC61D8L2_9FIRM|nr:histidine kinase [Sporanaerobium hydrogeniformans]PHV69706.1 hypothetical protein CS063_14510 [Sporanaerobium hydrogeniformans]
MEKEVKRGKLKWRMIHMLISGWLFPLMLLSISMLILVANKNNKQIKQTILVSTKRAVDSCTNKINNAIIASKNASYSNTIRESYYEYKENTNYQQFYNEITQFLNQQYRYNDVIRSAMLYFVDNPDIVYYTYSNVAGATYGSVGDFKNSAQKIVHKEAKELGTRIKFITINGKLYLIRNMVTPNYTPFAVLTMEINTKALFENLSSIAWYTESMVYIEEHSLMPASSVQLESYKIYLNHPLSSEPYIYDDKEMLTMMAVKVEGQQFKYFIKLDKAGVINESEAITYLFFIFVLFMLPLMVMIFYFFHKNITLPMGYLVKASHEIEKGNFDIRLPIIKENTEFRYLGETFNRMTDKLQNLFQKIYLEELALRDANIMALQSQINPHFLNNTLEIINWESRIAGNSKVSLMIEALSVMLEATMNRKKESLISLEEELTYIDAYLYIIGERFGDKFKFYKEVEPHLLDVQIPRLIIQPIMENAVEYGMDEYGRREVFLNIYQRDEYLVIEIKDSGTLNKQDIAKIEALLNDQQDKAEKGSLNLGIYNVNKRLKIIYGEESGLTIKKGEDNHTCSTILLKCESLSQQNTINSNTNH